jgi:ATP-dependent protease HslVU (ClpYQ) peptidase subunit
MTSIAAFVEEGRIYLASDQQLSAGFSAINTEYHKFLEVGENGTTIIGVAGSASILNLVRDYAIRWREEMAKLKTKDDSEFNTNLELRAPHMSFGEYIITFKDVLDDYIRERLSLITDDIDHSSAILVACPVGLFSIAQCGHIEPIKEATAVGSGKTEVVSYIDLHKDTFSDKHQLLVEAITHASKRDMATNDNITLMSVAIDKDHYNYGEDFFKVLHDPEVTKFYEEKKAFDLEARRIKEKELEDESETEQRIVEAIEKANKATTSSGPRVRRIL